MTELRRTRSGVFTIDQAHDLDRLDNLRARRACPRRRSCRGSSRPPTSSRRVRSGLQLPPETLGIAPEIYERFQMLDEHGELVAVGHVDANAGLYDRVFEP